MADFIFDVFESSVSETAVHGSVYAERVEIGVACDDDESLAEKSSNISGDDAIGIAVVRL